VESNGDIASFGWVQGRILQSMASDGTLNPDHAAGLAKDISAIESLLQGYRARRKQLGDSGKYTAAGLREAEAELAAPVIAEIRKILDPRHLDNNIAQKRRALQAGPPGDPTQQLLHEIRALREDIAVQNTQYAIQAMKLADDPLKAEMLYKEALAGHDHLTQKALERWPLRSPISDELRRQGEAQRESAGNPLLAAEVRELEALRTERQRVLRDALQELPLPQPDPIAEMAAGGSVGGEGQESS
jgi:hypothetical protein